MVRHGMTNTPTWSSWTSMHKRCYLVTHAKYANYGGRGINVCDRWRGNFIAFLEDMGLRPDGCSLDRVDSNGAYCKDNCRWATAKMQNRNKRTTRMIQGRPMSEWAELLGVNASTLRERANRWGDCIEVIETPVQHHKPKPRRY